MIVTCIIPTYQKFDYLWETIDSVLEQDYPSIELIIADDASDNINEQLISQYIEHNKKENLTSYKIVRHESNVGTVKNLNSAISISNGCIIFPLSSDDKLAAKNVISLVVKKFKESKCNVLVCSRQKCSKDAREKIRLMPHPGYIRYINSHMSTAEDQFMHMALGSSMEFASGSSMYYTKDFFESIGGYDERYILWEDGPFIAKVTRLGYKIETAYDIVAIFYRDGGISSKAKKNTAQSRIEKDYSNAIANEYLRYSDRFNKNQLKILKGRYELMKNNGNLSLKIILNYPGTVLNLVMTKMRKFMCIYMYNH